jgi:hypothetical protein
MEYISANISAKEAAGCLVYLLLLIIALCWLKSGPRRPKNGMLVV